MKLPSIFALLTLFICLNLTESRGWRHIFEHKGDLYTGIASAIADGEGYRSCSPQHPEFNYGNYCQPGSSTLTAYRLPVYPLFLAGLFKVFGMQDPLPMLRIAQNLLASAVVFLSVAYAQRLWSSGSAVVTGLVWLTSMSLYEFALMLYTEMLFAFLMIVLIWLLTFRAKWAFWIGVHIGVMLLTRGTLLLSVPFILLLLPLRRWPRVALGIALILTPWILRNALVFDAFIPFSSGSGAVLWGANNPIAYEKMDGNWISPTLLPYWNEYGVMDELTQDRAMTRDAIAFIGSQPVLTLAQVAVAKINFLLGGGYSTVYSVPVFVLIAFAGFYSIRRGIYATKRFIRHRRAVAGASSKYGRLLG